MSGHVGNHGAVDSKQVAGSSVALAFVRFRHGIVGETRRTVHLVPVAIDQPSTVGEFAEVITALCGQTFAPGECETLAAMTGMPCVNCLRLSPGPEDQAA